MNGTRTTYYRGYASSEAEAKELAKSLLTEYIKASGLEEKGGRCDASTLTEWDSKLLSLAFKYEGDGGEKKDVFVFIMKQAEEVYRLYLLFDEDRLPYYLKHVVDYHFFLPALQPTIKPEAPLPVEALLTYEGARQLDEAIDGGYLNEKGQETPAEKYLRKAKEAPKEKRIYAFFDDFGEMTLEEVKDALDAGDYDGAVIDAEATLSALTGKQLKTEKDYLSALADFAGKEEVEKYKEELLSSFRFCRAFRFVNFLQYELLRTEDYASVKAHYEEYASAIGYKEEYVDTLLHKGTEGTSTALDIALFKYLQHYVQLRTIYDGLSEDRLAEYLNAPKEAIRKVTAITKENTLL